MFFWFFALIKADSYINVRRYILGKWDVEKLHCPAKTEKCFKENFDIFLLEGDSANTVDVFMNSTEGQFFFKAIFTGNAIFEFTERDSSEKIAEFEFYSKLFPHLNAVGKWKEDSTYSAEFISQNSIHLSIFNRTNQDSYYYTFSKEVHQLSALEKKIPMILTAGMVIVKLLISEFRKRKAAIQRQIQSEKETKEFEEKELKELDEDQKEFMKKMKDAVHKSNDMFEDDEEIKKLEKEIQEDDRKEDEEIKKLEKELEEEEQNDDEDIKLEEIDESD